MNSFVMVALGLMIYITISMIVGRVMRNKEKKYGDYPKDDINGDGFFWPVMLMLWVGERVLNIIFFVLDKMVAAPLFWAIDKIVPNDDNVYESDYQRELRLGKTKGNKGV